MRTHDIIKPRRFSGDGWKSFGDVRHLIPSVFATEKFINDVRGCCVISAVETVLWYGVEQPMYHISISQIKPNGRLLSNEECEEILKLTGLDGWEEENHVRHSRVRNYWRAVNENRVGLPCPCVKTEPKERDRQSGKITRPQPAHIGNDNKN